MGRMSPNAPPQDPHRRSAVRGWLFHNGRASGVTGDSMSGKPKHGLSYTAEYRAWQTMRLRCLNPENEAYPDYGGRGITVCDRWLESPRHFFEDMGPKPSPMHELDRINNDGNYEPGNCRWATRKINDRNRRNNHWVEIAGERKTLAEWCELRRLPRSTVQKRLRAGWTPDRALSEPVGPSGPKMKACVKALMADAVPKRQTTGAPAESEEAA